MLFLSLTQDSQEKKKILELMRDKEEPKFELLLYYIL